jgi:hypothetical protein
MLINGARITWGIKCYLKVAINIKVKAFALEQTTTKGSFSHAGMMTVVTCTSHLKIGTICIVFIRSLSHMTCSNITLKLTLHVTTT